MNCPKCGAECSEGAKFCSKCGESLAALTPEPVSAATTPVADASAVTDTPKEATTPVHAGAGDAPKGSNTVIIVLIVALVAIIGAAGTGWYIWNKDKSASGMPTSSAPTSASEPQGAPGQSGAVPQQPRMPQVDEYGMPIKQSGATGQPEVGPVSGQQPVAPAQPGADLQQPPPTQSGANLPQQEVMPEPMPQEVRKRRAANENPSPRRNVKMAGSIDDQYHQRAASECPQGASGLFCREKVRYQLCNKHWSPSPPPGQSVCQQAN